MQKRKQQTTKQLKAMFESKSPGCFYTFTHSEQTGVLAAAGVSFWRDSEDGLLQGDLSFKEPFWIDKAECHAVLDYMDLGGFSLTSTGQSNLYNIQSINL